MIQRFYVHNFRCLENFELSLKGIPSALLIGKNGAGKSTIARALEVLQSIGRGINRVGQLVQDKDFTRGRLDVPIRFQIEVLLEDKIYKYTLTFELPAKFRELRVCEEELSIDGHSVYSRRQAQVTFSSYTREAQFQVDWHLVALPVIQEPSERDRLQIFKTWLARMIILAPIPALMTGDSQGEILEPKKDSSNFGEWLSGLLSFYPAAYMPAYEFLRDVMPDIQDFQNEQIGKDAKNMVVNFKANDVTLSVDFKDLSDGEKCFFLCAVVLAANQYYGPLFCFWDEPDNHLSLSEVRDFITSLRRSFKNKGQILTTSHNEEAIRTFSDENTFILTRESHLEPTLVMLLRDTPIIGNVVNNLIRGDI